MTAILQDQGMIPVMNDSVKFLSPSSDCGPKRRTKSYLNKRERTKLDRKDNISVKDSLEKFLANSQDEDLLFIAEKNEETTTNGDDRDETKTEFENNDDDDDDGMTVHSDALFDRDALRMASGTRSRLKMPRRNSLNSLKSEKTRDRPKRERRQRKPRRTKPNEDEGNDVKEHENHNSNTSFDDESSAASFAMDNDQDAGGSVSPSDFESRRCPGNRRQTSSVASHRFQNEDPEGDLSTLLKRSSSGRYRRRERSIASNSVQQDDSIVSQSPHVLKRRSSGVYRRRESNRSVTSHRLQENEEDRSVSPPRLERKNSGMYRRQGSGRSLTSRRQQPDRTKSLQVSSQRRLPRRSRSEVAGGIHRHNTNRGRESATVGLSVDVKDLDRQLRRARMKSEYRTPSPGRLSHKLKRQNSSDGNESVASGASQFTTSSYNPSGLEGGILNAFMATNDNGRNGTRCKGSGGSIATTPADEAFMKERKAQQDLIMDDAVKEKWRLEAEAAKAEKEKIVTTEYYSSDEELGTKKKGLVKQMKKAVRKTAKLSKSGAKGAANVVLDPKRTAKRAGKVASSVGKETAKMVMDPSRVAKKGTKGIKDTMTLTASVAKGSFDITTNLTKKGIMGTAKVANDTIGLAGRAVSGATEIFFQQENSDEEESFEDYDPRDLSHRQKQNETLVERLSRNGDQHIRNRSKGRYASPRSEIQLPALELNEPRKNKSVDSWDV